MKVLGLGIQKMNEGKNYVEENCGYVSYKNKCS
jgi:hypothetical protein